MGMPEVRSCSIQVVSSPKKSGWINTVNTTHSSRFVGVFGVGMGAGELMVGGFVGWLVGVCVGGSMGLCVGDFVGSLVGTCVGESDTGAVTGAVTGKPVRGAPSQSPNVYESEPPKPAPVANTDPFHDTVYRPFPQRQQMPSFAVS